MRDTKNTLLQRFGMENKYTSNFHQVFINIKWELIERVRKSGQFAMLIVNHFTSVNVSFLELHYIQTWKREWKTIFNNNNNNKKNSEICFLWKTNWSEQFVICYNRWSLYNCGGNRSEGFVRGIYHEK